MNEPGSFQPYNTGLSRRYAILGAGPVFTFASDAFPTVPVSDEGMDFDLRALVGIRTFSSYRLLAASVANLSICTFVNPAKSGVLAILEALTFYANATGDVVSGLAYSVLVPGTSQIGCATDTRVSRIPTGSSQVRQGTLNQAAAPASSGQLFGQFFPAAGQWDFTMHCPVLIEPGMTFFIYHGVVNTTISVGATWRERAIVPQEVG